MYAEWKEWGLENPECIGEGAFASVYRLWDSERKRYCACKVSVHRELLREEAGLLDIIKHPLFPVFYGYEESEDYGLLLMEYVDGEEVGELLRRGYIFDEKDVVTIIRCLAEGLCYLHERGCPILFRDLKPQNVLLDRQGRVRLVDLGSAVRMRTSDGVITGTPGYAAPEQLYPGGAQGTFNDVYALGRLMQEMLAGSKIHAGVRKIMEGCVESIPGKRIPNMRCVLYQLTPYVAKNKLRMLQADLEAFFFRKWKPEYSCRQNVIVFKEES